MKTKRIYPLTDLNELSAASKAWALAGKFAVSQEES